MTPKFGKEYIQEEFRRIDEELEDVIEIYLIGGGSMAFNDLKDTTKDIDVVVMNETDFRILQDSLLSLDYQNVKEPIKEYRELGAQTILENEDNCRFDIFKLQVVDKLIFSDSMRDRSKKLFSGSKLEVKITSKEDIFVFKSVARRTADIEDMNILVQTGLDFEVTEQEIEKQRELLGEDIFVTYIEESLIELEERFGVKTPLNPYLESISKKVYQRKEILMHIEEEIAFENLKTQVGINEKDLKARLDELEGRDKIIQNGETIEEPDD